jgi:hypothetical protein
MGGCWSVFLKDGLTFMMRMKEVREIWMKGKRHNIREVAEKVNRKVKFSTYARFEDISTKLILQF